MTIYSEQGQLIPDSALYPNVSPMDPDETGAPQNIPTARFASQWYSTTAHYADLCWACCAQMVQQILTGSPQSLDTIVQEVIGDQCTNAFACDEAWDPGNAYSRLNINFAPSPGDPTVSAGPLDITYVVNLLTGRNGPLQYRIAWGAQAHTALIVGYYEDNKDVYIMDPIYGEGPIDFDLIAGGYWNSGRWTSSWYGFRV
ncbi:hypothetical protein P3T20_004073 [Paraburkholderia sp. GAS206C]|uniref:papain-like cysteine protease family protein n=1 Tax=unclassified Paraburkholderia TaxID=2615204 RepID=UPI003D1BD2CB